MRGNPSKIIGKGFDKRPENINRTGANRKTISNVNIELEEMGYTEANKNDIVSCYLRLIQIPIPDLTQKVADNKQPALVRIVGKAILSGKGFDIIEKMLDRAIGRPDQKTQNENTNTETKTINIVYNDKEINLSTKK
jgi:hypothetical protein